LRFRNIYKVFLAMYYAFVDDWLWIYGYRYIIWAKIYDYYTEGESWARERFYNIYV